MRSTVLTVLTADGCEEPELAGTTDRRGAIGGTELGVDAADVRADRVRRDRQLAGDLRPGQVRRKIPQYPELARAELFRQRRCGLVFGRQGRAVHEVEDVGEQRGMRRLMPWQRL